MFVALRRNPKRHLAAKILHAKITARKFPFRNDQGNATVNAKLTRKQRWRYISIGQIAETSPKRCKGNSQKPTADRSFTRLRKYVRTTANAAASTPHCRQVDFVYRKPVISRSGATRSSLDVIPRQSRLCVALRYVTYHASDPTTRRRAENFRRALRVPKFASYFSYRSG
jgi:hypothetical protein